MFTLVIALLRGGGRRTALDLGLTVVGTAIPVAITLLVVGTVTGFQEREDAMAWREPTAVADAEASALQLRRYEPWRGERIDVVEFRSLGPDAPVPPGMDRFPSPGEIWVSPALERLLDSEEASALLPSRLGGEIAGVLGPEALSHQDELVAVVGNPDLEETPPEDLLGLDHRILGGFVPSDVVAIDRFASEGTDPGLPTQYRVAAWIAGVLLVAPSVALIGAAARLTATRRSRRLAALRLVGATSGQVTLLAAMETAFAALLGIALGAATALAGMAIVTGIPLGGGTFAFSDLLPSPGLWLVVVVGSLLGAVLAALAGLRRARTTPLGVVRQTGHRRPAWRRLLVMVGAWAVFAASVPFTQESGQYTLLAAGLTVVILSISAVGPLFTWILGRLTVATSQRARTLVAGRRMMADPVASFRPTTGLILVSFIAGFLLLSSVTLPYADADEHTFVLGYPYGAPDEATWEEWRAEISTVYPEARFDGSWPDPAVVLPEVMDPEMERPVIAEITGTTPLTTAEVGYEIILFGNDVRRATWIVVIIALIQAAFATGVGAAASVLEESTTLAALHLAGAPTATLQTSRALQAALPITVGSAIFTTLGAVAGAMTIVGVSPDTTIAIPSALQAGLVVVAAGIAAFLGTEATRPVLNSVVRRPLAER